MWLFAEVLKWQAPPKSAQILKAEEEAAAAAARQRAERQYQMVLQQEEELAKEQELVDVAPEDNPLPDEVRLNLSLPVRPHLDPLNASGSQEEMRVLAAMGWDRPDAVD